MKAAKSIALFLSLISKFFFILTVILNYFWSFCNGSTKSERFDATAVFWKAGLSRRKRNRGEV